MKRTTTLYALALVAGGWLTGGLSVANAAEGCLSCHEGIEDIRDPNTAMMAMIKAKGAPLGDPAGCVVCHGGDPKAALASIMPAPEYGPAPENYARPMPVTALAFLGLILRSGLRSDSPAGRRAKGENERPGHARGRPRPRGRW